jgi:hypothetical protein
MALGIHIKPSHQGLFHKDMGKKEGAPITSADIAKGKRSENPAERKRATFAANARKWNHRRKSNPGEANARHASKLYGKE